nr:restriction endonuclease subunit S [Halochromatium salexigens]
MPKHWEINKVKHIFRLSCKPAPANNDLELLSVYTDIGVRPRRELEQKGNKASTTDGYWIVRKGDLVVNKLLAWMGAVGHSEYDGVTSPAYDILRPINNGNSKYYHYLFRSETAQQELKRFSKGIMEMRLRLYFDQLGNIFVPEPPREEQDRIVSYIETEIDMRLSSLQDSIDQSVSKLHEFRSALITAAVTGQIDVTTWSRRDSTDRRLDQIEEEMSV